MPSEFQVVERENSTDSTPRSSPAYKGERLTAIRQELEYLNTMGKRFVAAFDRFQVHRALLAALRDLYSFSACCILLKGDPLELFIIPSYPLSASFLEAMIQRIASAANVIDFPHVEAEQLARSAYLDAPDELALPQEQGELGEGEIGSCLNIPLTVENRIMGMLSLFDERIGTFDTNLLQLTTMIADYAAVALENVRLRERENALWRQTEFERQRLELIIKSMAEGLLITDAQGAILSLNQSAQHLLAQANIDFQTGIPLHKLIKTSDADWLLRLAEIVAQALKNKVVTNQELTIGDGSETVPLTLNISAAPLHDASEVTTRPIGVVAVLNDVTSNKQVERLKDEFVSVVSHELRTPLTAIKGYTQHVARRMERRLRKARTTVESNTPISELPESYDLRSLNIIQSQTEHLERLVNDLLDLSQVQWGKLNLRYETFYLADILAESVRLAQASAELHTLYLDIQVQETAIVADRIRIEQVIGNLLDNAIKYSPHGGKVTIRLEEQEGKYLVSIIDEGIGVSPEQFDHIFERFYRVHNTSIQQYSGIGLGLYVAKAIVDRHGGQIWFANNQNIGSTFHFTLPRKPSTVPLSQS
ncbi:MAG: GAF domain-containing protein [Ktedonobacteraceae bacterium]|nr:GAF domain-containing protein [Ktedonobacteraceae bacterium]MBV9616422.1 GAF domain-containing protein [Ktedonobacteraceae bacterium]MBV9712704.1 GAF domain-containing protein [Ktedonobacteraceae bacterium]